MRRIALLIHFAAVSLSTGEAIGQSDEVSFPIRGASESERDYQQRLKAFLNKPVEDAKAAQEAALGEKSPPGDPFKWARDLTVPGSGGWEIVTFSQADGSQID